MKKLYEYLFVDGWWFIYVLPAALAAVAIYSIYTTPELHALKLNKAELKVELAETEAEHKLGLGGRQKLSSGCGMLFIFADDDFHAFWMKDVPFIIDIVWISKDWKVVDVAKYVLPDSFPDVLRPRAPARYVLEVSAGWADENNVKAGDFVLVPSLQIKGGRK